MKSSSRWLITGLACLAIFTALAAFKFFQIQAAIAYGKSYPEPSESVEAVITERETFTVSISTIGEIVAPQSLELRNEVEGLVTAVNFASGDRVNKDDILIQLDVSEEAARLQAAQARVELTRLALERAQRLIRQKGVSEETVDQAQANYVIAQADVVALQATIAKKTLRAPFTAVSGLHQLEVGQYLQSNTALVTLVGVQAFSWVDFNLPADKADLAVGDTVAVELPGDQAAVFSATVIARDATASVRSRNLKIRARVEGSLPAPPNTIVRVVVPVGSSEQVALPRTAIQVDSLGNYVFVLEANGEGQGYRASRRQVVLGFQGQDKVGVVSGLEVGERVVAKGAFKLLPNMLTFIRERPLIDGAAQE